MPFVQISKYPYLKRHSSSSLMSSSVIDLTTTSSVIDLTSTTITPRQEAQQEEEGDHHRGDDENTEEEEEEWQHLVELNGATHRYVKIVGIRYYHGVAHPGEYVTLVREPRNPYDRFAIRIDNMGGEKVGHIKKELAAVLSPIMDRYGPTQLKIDGTIPGPGTYYDLPLKLRLYGAAGSSIDAVEIASKFYGLAFNTKAAAVAAAAAAAPAAAVVHKRAVDWKEQQKHLDDLFEQQNEDKLSNLPLVELPCCLTSSLLDHQVTGIRWLVSREKNTELPFWKQVQEQNATKWYCEITRSSQDAAPVPVKGSILADDMGLGKTIQTIGLILAHPPPGRDYNIPLVAKNKDVDTEDGGTTLPADAAATVSPSSTTSGAEDVEKQQENLLNKPTKTNVKKLKVDMLLWLAMHAGVANHSSLKKDQLISAIFGALDRGTLSVKAYYEAVEAYTKKAAATKAAPSAGSNQSTSSSSSQTTLIVCPVSVISNWQSQIDAHVAPNTFRVALYHGTDRHELLDSSSSGSIDVLIASYNTLQHDYRALNGNSSGGNNSNKTSNNDDEKVNPPAPKRAKKGLSIFQYPFYRVVLDEAHNVRNSKTGMFQATNALKATYRLCLTGTPLQNKPEDIHSLFRFLQIEPFSKENDIFRRAISQPIKDGEDSGLTLLRTLMAHYALRRNKSGVAIDLPPKLVELRLVEFPHNSPHQRVHDTIYDSAKAALRASIATNSSSGGDGAGAAAGGSGDISLLSAHSASIFEILTRLRQACCSGKLVPPERLQRAEQVLAKIQTSGNSLTPEEAVELLAKLKGALLDAEEGVPPECAICMESMSEDRVVVLRGCGHVFCQGCISNVLMSTNCYGNSANKCPFCRHAFEKPDMIPWKAAAAQAEQQQQQEVVALSQQMDQLGPSPKMQALVESIAEMQPGEKGVIFSQFTKFLDEIGKYLMEHGKSFTRIDGSKSVAQRMQAMSAFSSTEEGSPDFILCSLHAAGTGINLTRANHIYMMDTWWNKAVETQAFDRVHRIGQTRNVRVVRFVTADSIESRMVELQEQKEALGKGVFAKLSAEETKKARFGDIQKLLEL